MKKTPSTKIQDPEKIQTSSSNPAARHCPVPQARFDAPPSVTGEQRLDFGSWFFSGSWILVLGSSPSHFTNP
jgi:hypothetical protein